MIVPTLRVGMHPVTLCVTLHKAGRRASGAAFPRRAWDDQKGSVAIKPFG